VGGASESTDAVIALHGGDAPRVWSAVCWGVTCDSAFANSIFQPPGSECAKRYGAPAWLQLLDEQAVFRYTPSRLPRLT